MKVNKFLKIILVFVCLFSFIAVHAEEELTTTDNNQVNVVEEKDNKSYVNENTNFAVYIDDQKDLLTDIQEKSLVDDMKGITDFGNAIFVSIDCTTSTSVCANNYYHQLVGAESGTMFMIDMNDRMLYIFSDGKIYDVVTRPKAEVITDNTYRYASNGDYYGCASTAFNQINQLLVGEKIAEPMRYITNGLFAIFLGFLLCFSFIMASSKMNKNTRILKNNYIKSLELTNFVATITGHHTVYNPPSDSGGSSGWSSGGGGGFSGGGGGFSGGGGHSGGGGGHHF